jgi:hypothetical protein
VILTVTDDNGAIDNDTTTVFANGPPDKPTIYGLTSGNAGTEYEYTFVSQDIEADDLFFYIDWGDGNNTGWIGPYFAGGFVKKNHTWNEPGTFIIKAKSKDTCDAESRWGELTITIPRNKAAYSLLFQWLFERFPLLERLLSLIKMF